MAINYETKTREDMMMKNLEHQIKNNKFKSKEELIEYLSQTKKTGISIDNKKNQEILSLYDSLHHKDTIPLDMTQYASVSMEKDDLIVSKQELNLVSIDKAILMDNISTEILNKIKFFITNSKINPKSFKINVGTGLFYNAETDEVYEVRKNVSTNQYEIYKGSTKMYGNSEQNTQEEDTEPTLEHDILEERIDYESKLSQQKVKIKKLEKPKLNNMQNAAFTKIGFLIINILTFTILTAMIILLNK